MAKARLSNGRLRKTIKVEGAALTRERLSKATKLIVQKSHSFPRGYIKDQELPKVDGIRLEYANSVAGFAADLNMTAVALLEQLGKAGIPKSYGYDLLSEQDKATLLAYLRSRVKLTLRKKNTLSKPALLQMHEVALTENKNLGTMHEVAPLRPTGPDLGKPVPHSKEYEAAMRARFADEDADESLVVVSQTFDILADVKTSGVEKLSPDKSPKPAGRHTPDSTTATVVQYRRDASVRAWVLNSARGICECCKQDAPFKGADGLPYLEVHHVRQLAACGSDTVSNTVAICPNCHRELHFGENRQELVQHLLETVGRLVRE
jgi:hypothetical protein